MIKKKKEKTFIHLTNEWKTHTHTNITQNDVWIRTKKIIIWIAQSVEVQTIYITLSIIAWLFVICQSVGDCGTKRTNWIKM